MNNKTYSAGELTGRYHGMLTAGGASVTLRDVVRSHAGLGLENPGKAIQNFLFQLVRLEKPRSARFGLNGPAICR
ncbi:hypothetical protein IFM47457_00025 [Aspergillus lentulus]|nr:hypothetical protein IFM47457_00025 [Aspergillus lentulus]